MKKNDFKNQATPYRYMLIMVLKPQFSDYASIIDPETGEYKAFYKGFMTKPDQGLSALRKLAARRKSNYKVAWLNEYQYNNGKRTLKKTLKTYQNE